MGDCKLKPLEAGLVSSTISNLRFPLICLIVLMHCSMMGIGIHGNQVPEPGRVTSYMLMLLRNGVSDVGVPLFFMISGYLFFVNIRCMDRNTYKNKLARRVNTLLIPYLVWNAIALGLWCMKHSMQDVFPRIAELQITPWFLLSSFIQNTSIALIHNCPVVPMDGPLWYVRDLMVLVFFSPLIYAVMKNRILGGGVILGVLLFYWLFGRWEYHPYTSIVSVFFFTTGAYFGMHQELLTNKIKRITLICKYLIPIWIIFICYTFWTYPQHELFMKVNVMIGIPSVVSFAIWFTEKGWNIPVFLKGSVFFVFALHGIFVDSTTKLLWLLLGGSNSGPLLVLGTIMSFLIAMAVCLFFYRISLYLPRRISMFFNGK